jgi:hypothetical protein
VYQGPTVFAQVMAYAPHRAFQRCAVRYRGKERIRRFTYWDQFLVLAFAQLTYRESLRDIEVCLRAMRHRLYHMGLRCGAVARSTLADANERRDWRVYADFAQILIHEARGLYADEPLPVEIEDTVYAFDSTTIDLCLSLFPWAPFRAAKAAIRLHTLLDLRGNIPTFIHVTDGLVHDVNVLDLLIPEAGAIYVLDRGYVDFARLYVFHQASATFVTRAKKNFRFRRLYSHEVDRSTGVVCDQTVVLTIYKSRNDYPEKLRRIRYRDPETGKVLTFITNNFALSALKITELYRCRWQIELFFKWIKQHLRIKSFYGNSENAVKTQIWAAVCAYVLVAILRKRLQLEHLSLYTILQIVSVTAFEQVPILHALSGGTYTSVPDAARNQLQLFDL